MTNRRRDDENLVIGSQGQIINAGEGFRNVLRPASITDQGTYQGQPVGAFGPPVDLELTRDQHHRGVQPAMAAFNQGLISAQEALRVIQEVFRTNGSIEKIQDPQERAAALDRAVVNNFNLLSLRGRLFENSETSRGKSFHPAFLQGLSVTDIAGDPGPGQIIPRSFRLASEAEQGRTQLQELSELARTVGTLRPDLARLVLGEVEDGNMSPESAIGHLRAFLDQERDIDSYARLEDLLKYVGERLKNRELARFVREEVEEGGMPVSRGIQQLEQFIDQEEAQQRKPGDSRDNSGDAPGPDQRLQELFQELSRYRPEGARRIMELVEDGEYSVEAGIRLIQSLLAESRGFRGDESGDGSLEDRTSQPDTSGPESSGAGAPKDGTYRLREGSWELFDAKAKKWNLVDPDSPQGRVLSQYRGVRTNSNGRQVFITSDGKIVNQGEFLRQVEEFAVGDTEVEPGTGSEGEPETPSVDGGGADSSPEYPEFEDFRRDAFRTGPGGERYFRGAPELPFQLLPTPSLDELIMQKILDKEFDFAKALHDLKTAPDPERQLQLALEFARSPADVFTLSNIARGNLPLPQLDASGQVRRVGPQPEFLQTAYRNLFQRTDPFAALAGLAEQPAPGASLPTGGDGGSQDFLAQPNIATGQLGKSFTDVAADPLHVGNQQVSAVSTAVNQPGLDLPLGVQRLLEGGAVRPARSFLTSAGIRTPSAQALNNLTSGELDVLFELGRLSGIPEADFRKQIMAGTPAAAASGRFYHSPARRYV